MGRNGKNTRRKGGEYLLGKMADWSSAISKHLQMQDDEKESALISCPHIVFENKSRERKGQPWN
jgi:hypothetical protein